MPPETTNEPSRSIAIGWLAYELYGLMEDKTGAVLGKIVGVVEMGEMEGEVKHESDTFFRGEIPSEVQETS